MDTRPEGVQYAATIVSITTGMRAWCGPFAVGRLRDCPTIAFGRFLSSGTVWYFRILASSSQLDRGFCFGRASGCDAPQAPAPHGFTTTDDARSAHEAAARPLPFPKSIEMRLCVISLAFRPGATSDHPRSPSAGVACKRRRPLLRPVESNLLVRI